MYQYVPQYIPQLYSEVKSMYNISYFERLNNFSWFESDMDLIYHKELHTLIQNVTKWLWIKDFKIVALKIFEHGGQDPNHVHLLLKRLCITEVCKPQILMEKSD